MSTTDVKAPASRLAVAGHPSTKPAIAYLISYYPKLSHTFIRREVEAMREQGFDVQTYSVRASPPEEIISAADEREMASTTYLLDGNLAGIAAAHLRMLVSAPKAYLRTLRSSLRTGHTSLRAKVWQLFYFVEAVRLVTLLRRDGLRHIHVHFANNAADVARTAVVLGKALEPDETWQWTMSMHGSTEFLNTTLFDLGPKAESASLVACISDYTRSQMMTLTAPVHWPKLHVVHMGVDVDQTVQPRTPRPGQPLRLLFVGRIIPEKGVPLLMDALQELNIQGYELETVIVGDGPLRPGIEATLSARGLTDRVRFIGAIGQDHLHEWYEWADVFCLPSFTEGLPVVLMEALLFRLAVVTTTVAGIPELVRHGETGLLTTPGRLDSLVEALVEVATDPERRRALGEAGRAEVLANFDAAQNAIALGQLFRDHVS